MHATQNTVAEQVTTPARTLRDAVLYLSRHGWTQGAYYDATSGSFTPPACLVGAVGIVCYGGPVDAPAHMFDAPEFADFDAALTYLDWYLALRFADSQYYERLDNAYDFNDAKGQTADAVIAALNAAADAWDRTNGTPTKDGCRCGDSDCADVMPRNQDRSGCCQYCGYYDCDVCGWSVTAGGAA